MRLRSALGITAAAAAFGLWGGSSMADDAARPRDPWVFRSVLDGRARMLTCVLNPKLNIAYDTQTASLRRAWSGDVLFTGGVYDTRHGPQPKSVGPAYFKAKDDQTAWSAMQNGVTLEAKPPRYLGYRTTDNGVKIEFAVDTPAGRTLVTESPECEMKDGRVSLARTFVVKDLPKSTVLTLDLTGDAADTPADTRLQSPTVAGAAEPPTTKPAGPANAVRFDRDGTYVLRMTWSVR